MKNSFDEKILEEANDWIKANQRVVIANSNPNLGFLSKTYWQSNDCK